MKNLGTAEASEKESESQVLNRKLGLYDAKYEYVNKLAKRLKDEKCVVFHIDPCSGSSKIDQFLLDRRVEANLQPL